MKKIVVVFVSTVMMAGLATASLIATDTASNYTTWASGDNGGSGFLSWRLWSTGTAGSFLGDSSLGLNGNTDLNTDSKSFGFWGNPSGGNYMNAERFFDGGALTLGQTFSIQLGVNFRNGNKGFDFLDASSNSLYTFNVTADQYYSGGTSLGWDYKADSIFTLSFTRTNTLSYSLSISRNDGSNYVTSLNLASEGAGFKLFIGDTDAGSDNNNLYVNNLSVIPEPTTLALFGLVGLGLLTFRRMRK